MLYKVTSLAFDPDSRTAFYTDQNYAFRELMAIDVDTGKKRKLLTDARIGDLALNRADKSLWGLRHQNGFVTLVRLPAPYTSFNQVKTFRYGEIAVRPRHLARRRADRRPPTATVDGKHSVQVWKRSDLEAGNSDEPVATPRARPLGAREFHLHARRQGAARQQLLYRRLERLPLRHRQPEI